MVLIWALPSDLRLVLRLGVSRCPPFACDCRTSLTSPLVWHLVAWSAVVFFNTTQEHQSGELAKSLWETFTTS